MTASDAGGKALELMNAVLAKRPDKDGHLLSEATLCLTDLREAITPDDWDGAPAAERARVARLNSIISVVMGLHFPVGSAPWDEFATARDSLSDLLAALPAGADR